MDHETEAERLERMGIGFQRGKVDHDPVNAPSHYKAGDTYETIRVIEAWQLGYNLGNCVKYISRAGKKDYLIQDLEKARWHLTRDIENLRTKADSRYIGGAKSEEDGI